MAESNFNMITGDQLMEKLNQEIESLEAVYSGEGIIV